LRVRRIAPTGTRRVVHAEPFIPESLDRRAEVLEPNGSARSVSAPVANMIDVDRRRYRLRRAESQEALRLCSVATSNRPDPTP